MDKEAIIDSTNSTAGSAELYLLSALLETEESLKHLTEQIKSKAVEVKKSESLGARNLTFPIKGHQALILASVFFTAEPSTIAELERELRHDNQVVRFLVTTWNDDINQPMRSARTKTFRPGEKTATPAGAQA